MVLLSLYLNILTKIRFLLKLGSLIHDNYWKIGSLSTELSSV